VKENRPTRTYGERSKHPVSLATAHDTMAHFSEGDRVTDCSAYARTDPIMHRAAREKAGPTPVRIEA
jgi:hypothetical protein